jgi:hypothetical protein
MKQPTHPCLNCIYFKACGETNRTEPCDGRVTKSQKKKENKKWDCGIMNFYHNKNNVNLYWQNIKFVI